MPPERWQKMSTAKKQKAIRLATLNKVSALMHIPQNTLRENYLGTISLLIEQDPVGYARELSFDADQLNFFLNDRARSAEIIKALVQEEKEREKEKTQQLKKVKKEPKKEKSSREKASTDLSPVNTGTGQSPEARIITEVPPLPEEPETKKNPAKSQSTLFDGF
jgi:replication factor C large subunit